MSDELFFHTIQYLDSLRGEGALDREKTRKLANFSLELGENPKTGRRRRKTDTPKHFTSPEETDEILSDIFSDDEWNFRVRSI